MKDLKKIFKEELNKRKIDENTYLSKVQNDGSALKFISESKRTPEICLVAVQNYGWAIQFISESNQTPEICLAAVQNDGSAISYVPVDIIEEILKSL